MSLPDGVAARVTYKFYDDGDMDANTPAVSADDLGSDGGQILRRVSSTMKLGKDTYQSNEVRSDRQIADFRHGTRRVTGGIVNGEFSPGTYFDFLEAVLRGTRAAAISATESDFTSVTADAAASKFTATSGNPVTKGFRIGSIVRATNLSAAGNNAKNFLITGFGGTSNRDIYVYPAPAAMSADTAFTLAEVGKSVIAPSTGLVRRKLGLEHYFEDADFARLFTEVRTDGFNLQLPASGLSTLDVTGMGRNMEIYKDGAAPFFTDPADPTTTGITAAVNGLLMLGGTRIGVVTGLNIQAQLNASGDPVVGQNIVPEVFLGRLNITGQMTVLLEDTTFMEAFLDETPLTLLSYLTSNNNAATPATSIFLPKIKINDADAPLQGEAGIPMTMPFQALKGDGTAAGEDATTIRIHDTEAA